MSPIPEAYPFKKFWDAFARQDRSVAKWDDKRTDQDVFIRRTMSKWFEGKSFQVIFDQYIPADPFPLSRSEPHRLKFTKYMLVLGIEFAYAAYHDQISITYAEPHSTKIEKMSIKSGDWYNISAQEDKESFTILRRFYPVERNKIKLPTL